MFFIKKITTSSYKVFEWKSAVVKLAVVGFLVLKFYQAVSLLRTLPKTVSADNP